VKGPFDRIILVYCRSGRRSKEASQKLYDMGYTNVFEFGGIIDWTGEVVTEETNAKYNEMLYYGVNGDVDN
jgi:rhodanese-related sulfurtransferase